MPPRSPLHLVFGEAIKRWRRERGLSQEQLAELIGMSPSFVGMLERGEKTTTLETVERLSDALSVEVRDFFIASEEDPTSHRHVLLAVAEILSRAPEQELQFFLRFCELFSDRLQQTDAEKSSS